MRRTLLLIGHQNSGKTTLFNRLTSSHYKTVNYPGSTVDCAVGTLKQKEGTVAKCLRLDQLQGPHVRKPLYGINEDLKTRITQQMTKIGASQQSQEEWVVIDTPGITSLVPHSEDEAITISCLNTIQKICPGASELPDQIALVLDQSQLSRQLVLYFQLIDAGLVPVVILTMPDLLQKEGKTLHVEALQEQLGTPVFSINSRSGEGISEALDGLLKPRLSMGKIALPESLNKETVRAQFNRAKEIAESVISLKKAEPSFDWDRIILHPIWGFFCFGGIMTFFFAAIFSGVAPLMDALNVLFEGLAHKIHVAYPGYIASALLADGLVKSVGAFMVFVPQIAMLFFLIGLMENSGFLARGAALMDRPLSWIGLNGRSFVPLLSGFACAIPAMMAARTIPGKRERRMTVFIIPLMQCSARLPVFGLLIGMLVKGDPLFGGLIMTGIYMGSIVLAALLSVIVSKWIPEEKRGLGFQLELPRWRMPIMRDVIRYAVHQSMEFVKKAGPLIMMVGLGLWALTYFPTPEHSYAIFLGKWMTPLWEPLGVDWRVGVAILLSFAAREVFVSALAVMFVGGMPVFEPAVSMGLIVFFMVSMQCFSTLAVAKKESGDWKLPLLMALTYSILGYVLAVLVRYSLS